MQYCDTTLRGLRCRHERPTRLGRPLCVRADPRRATRRCSASSICSFARRSCRGACGRERSCRLRGSLPRSSACRAPPWSRPMSSFSPKAIRPAGTGPAPTSRPTFPSRSKGLRSDAKSLRRQFRPRPCPCSRCGDFVDVTVQSDQRPFNLGRTLIDDRTLELWRKLDARTFRSPDASHFGYSDPRGTIELRQAICDYLQAARAVKCDPEQIVVTAGTQQAIDIVIRILAEPEQAGLGRRSRLSADAAGPDRRRRDRPSGSRRCTRHRRRRGHPVGAECLTPSS